VINPTTADVIVPSVASKHSSQKSSTQVASVHLKWSCCSGHKSPSQVTTTMRSPTYCLMVTSLVGEEALATVHDVSFTTPGLWDSEAKGMMRRTMEINDNQKPRNCSGPRLRSPHDVPHLPTFLHEHCFHKNDVFLKNSITLDN
jgi:hypothetical protein